MVDADGIEFVELLSFVDAVDLEGDGTLLLLFVEKEGNSWEPMELIEGDFLNTEVEIEVDGVGLTADMLLKHANKATIR